MDIKSIKKEYHEQLYAHKFDNLGEMDQFLDRHNLLKLMQEEIDNLNRPITIKEIELTINNFPKQELPGPDEFTNKYLRRNYTNSLHSLSEG